MQNINVSVYFFLRVCNPFKVKSFYILYALTHRFNWSLTNVAVIKIVKFIEIIE